MKIGAKSCNAMIFSQLIRTIETNTSTIAFQMVWIWARSIPFCASFRKCMNSTIWNTSHGQALFVTKISKTSILKFVIHPRIDTFALQIRCRTTIKNLAISLAAVATMRIVLLFLPSWSDELDAGRNGRI